MGNFRFSYKNHPLNILAYFQGGGNYAERREKGLMQDGDKVLSLICRSAVIPDVEVAQRVFFDEIGNLFVNRGVIVHLLLQGLVLGADVPEECGRIAQKFGGKVGISGHLKDAP
jgi:hypothetical protein